MSNPSERSLNIPPAQKFVQNLDLKFEWQFVGPLLEKEVVVTRGWRRVGGWKPPRQFANSVLAAEFFPDRWPPELVIAGSEQKTHDDLRAKFPSTDSRLSGEIIRIGNQPFSLFLMDSVSRRNNLSFPLIKRPPTEIIAWLYSQNYVPLTALAEIIIPKQSFE